MLFTVGAVFFVVFDDGVGDGGYVAVDAAVVADDIKVD